MQNDFLKPNSIKQSKMKFKKLLRILFAIGIFLNHYSFFGQETADDSNKWQFTIGPYVLFPHMNGEVIVKGIPADVDTSPGDIFENLDFGMMLYFEASNSKWVAVLDGLYMDLSQEGETVLTGRKVLVGVDQVGFSISGRYKIKQWLDAGVGGRINSIGSNLKIDPGDILPGTEFSMNETWFDPIIVARLMTNFNNEKWQLGLYTDIGGFGIGSDITWQINPFASYQLGNWFKLGAAYRWLGINYTTGTGAETFLYDVTTSGPEIRFLFNF